VCTSTVLYLSTCYERVTRVLQGCYEGVTRVLRGCCKDATRVSLGCYRVLQGCHKGVTRMLQGCYKGVTVRALHLAMARVMNNDDTMHTPNVKAMLQRCYKLL
jgi:hypothetical protein